MRSRVAPEFEPEIEVPVHDPSPSELEREQPGARQPDKARLLWDQRSLILRWAGRGVVLATLIAFLMRPYYESTTRLMPPDNQSGMGMALLATLGAKSGDGAGAGLGALAGDLVGLKTSGALFTDILRSRTVRDRLVNRFDLRKVYWERYMEDARKDLGRHTSISEDRKSGVITVTVEDHNAERAAGMAQAYVEELDRLVAEVSTSSARRERIFIEQRLVAVKKDLNRAAQEFGEFASKNTTLDMKEQTKAMVESGAMLQAQLIAAQSELQGLEQIYTPHNVRVRALRARIAELEHQLQRFSGNSAMPSPESQPANQLYPPIRQLPLLGVRWAELYREAKVQETLYELLTQQYEISKIEEAKEIPTVKVIDRGVVPDKKSFPPRLLIIVLGTLLCVLAGCAWVIGTARWRALDANDPAKAFVMEVGAVQKAWLICKREQLRGWTSRKKTRPAGRSNGLNAAD